MKPVPHANGHGDIDSLGKGHHDSGHADASASVSQIGHPFTPMVHGAPVQALSVMHAVVRCWSPGGCHSATYWAPGHDLPTCASCAMPLDPQHVTHREAPRA